MVSTQRERKRVSWAKRPIVGSEMSPSSSETQNVEPSRIVKGTFGFYSSLTIASWLACWSGLTTISSTTMCAGRVTAHRMQSVTSSGVR